MSGKTVAQAAADALAVQDACNLSGVVRDWSESLEAIWAQAHAYGLGTDWVNHHPISKLYANKAAALTGSWDTNDYSLEEVKFSREECQRIVHQGDTIPASPCSRCGYRDSGQDDHGGCLDEHFCTDWHEWCNATGFERKVRLSSMLSLADSR